MTEIYNAHFGRNIDNIATDILFFFFAGCITSSSPTAGPADVLIQSSPPHRRARSAAWTYHFYPDEAWVDITITLPCAVLLKEIHIQPHLTALASTFIISFNSSTTKKLSLYLSEKKFKNLLNQTAVWSIVLDPVCSFVLFVLSSIPTKIILGVNNPNGLFTLPKTETKTIYIPIKCVQNPMEICIDLCFWAVWTPPQNSTQGIFYRSGSLPV